MNRKQADAYLRKIGHPELFVSKAGGIWYLIGDKPGMQYNIERCLHVVRTEDLSRTVIDQKISELFA